MRLHFVCSDKSQAVEYKDELDSIYSEQITDIEEADYIVTLGGDGFLFHFLRSFHKRIRSGCGAKIFPINFGTVGFLTNERHGSKKIDIIDRIAEAETEIIYPFQAKVFHIDGTVSQSFAINDFVFFRNSLQTSWLKIVIDGQTRLNKLVGDGLIISSPLGSTAYNYSAHGAILPIGSSLLVLTPINSLFPRHWPGAVLLDKVEIAIEVLDYQGRPVIISADNMEIQEAFRIEVKKDVSCPISLLYDKKHNLYEKVIRQQFS